MPGLRNKIFIDTHGVGIDQRYGEKARCYKDSTRLNIIIINGVDITDTVLVTSAIRASHAKCIQPAKRRHRQAVRSPKAAKDRGG